MTDREEVQKRLFQFAQGKGIEPEYWDIWGNYHAIPEDRKVEILRAMGYDIQGSEDLEKEIQKEKEKAWKQVMEPILVVSEHSFPRELAFHIPVTGEWDRSCLPGDIQIRLQILEEKGETRVHTWGWDQLQFLEAVEFEGLLYARGSLSFSESLPLGVHSLTISISVGDQFYTQVSSLIVCPEQSYLPPALKGSGKRAGLSLSLAGLRSRNNWGVGDLGDLKELIRWAILVLKVDVIGLLPLHALTNREPYNISPYYPSSRLYRNPIYLAVPEIEEYSFSLPAREMVWNSEVQGVLKELRESEKVRFEKAYQLKRKVLERLFETFLDRHWKEEGQETDRQKEFLAYMEREGDLLDLFAVYSALEAHFRQENPEIHTWRQWPKSFQDPGSPEVHRFKKDRWQAVLFEKYLQWQIEVQLTEVQDLALYLGAEIGLYCDLALGSDPWGADSWAWQGYSVAGIRVGAPPDDFSPRGQEWGFCPPNGEKYRQGSYQLFAWEIRKNCHPAGALRIDHILKLSRLFWILEGQEAKDGAYVQYPLEELMSVLALESVRNKTLIIGEDLGTLPDNLREILHRVGIFSYRLFYFEKDNWGNLKAPEAYPELALASVSTHDLPPLARFWSMEDIVLRAQLGFFPEEAQFHQALEGRINEKRRMIDRLRELGFLNEEERLVLQAQDRPLLTDELHRAVLSFLVFSKAKLVVISQEDLFQEDGQLNLPGTVSEHPNWSRKMRFSLEELWTHPEARKMAGLFRGLIEQSGRAVQSKKEFGV